jgi:predicted O-methyltransferase YrrM
MEFLEDLRCGAFDELQVNDYKIDLQGWLDEDNFTKVFLKSLPKKKDGLVIVEVGTWKGKSAVHMATILKREGYSNFKIVCIDTWLGAQEFWTDRKGGIRDLVFVNGYPSIFYTFTKNVKKLGHDDVICPFPLSSSEAAYVLDYYKIKPDIIYIDAAHEYEAVKHDISLYWPLVKEGGVLMGDDYHWRGVSRAVDEFGSCESVGKVWSRTK